MHTRTFCLVFCCAILSISSASAQQRTPVQAPPDVKANEHVCDTIPKCELVLLPSIGHVPHLETPDMFYKALLKFLKA
jgi:hypothetical protein